MFKSNFNYWLTTILYFLYCLLLVFIITATLNRIQRVRVRYVFICIKTRYKLQPVIKRFFLNKAIFLHRWLSCCILYLQLICSNTNKVLIMLRLNLQSGCFFRVCFISDLDAAFFIYLWNFTDTLQPTAFTTLLDPTWRE